MEASVVEGACGKGRQVDERHLLGYLRRRAQELQDVIDSVRVFSKRYDAAVDELEEVEELLADRQSARA